MTNNNKNMTPQDIVKSLDKYIIGQKDAKKMLRLHLEIDGEE